MCRGDFCLFWIIVKRSNSDFEFNKVVSVIVKLNLI